MHPLARREKCERTTSPAPVPRSFGTRDESHPQSYRGSLHTAVTMPHRCRIPRLFCPKIALLRLKSPSIRASLLALARQACRSDETRLSSTDLAYRTCRNWHRPENGLHPEADLAHSYNWSLVSPNAISLRPV